MPPFRYPLNTHPRINLDVSLAFVTKSLLGILEMFLFWGPLTLHDMLCLYTAWKYIIEN